MAKKKTIPAEPVSAEPAVQQPVEAPKDLDVENPKQGPAGPGRPFNPVAAAFMTKPPDHDFTFDVASLDSDLDGIPDVDEYSRLLAVEVHQQMVQETAQKIVTFDPLAILKIGQAIAAIIKDCRKDKVESALDVAAKRPKSLAAKRVRLALARRLPADWSEGSLEAARAIIQVGIEHRNEYATLVGPPAATVSTPGVASVDEMPD
jgi:hypothetical protein